MEADERWGAWLAQLVQHMPLDLRVVSLSPMVGVEITGGKKRKEMRGKKLLMNSTKEERNKEKEALSLQRVLTLGN